MTVIFQIAVRNLLRNRKRSVITIAAVMLGLGAMIFLRSFIFGAQHQMAKNITETVTGEISIFPKALENIYNTNGAIEDPEALRVLLRADPRLVGFAEEIYGAGIAASPTASVMSFVTGLDPEMEQAIGSKFPLVSGHLMSRAEPDGVVMGEKMRKMLGVELGEKVVVTVQDYTGAFAGEAFTLIGTLESGSDQLDSATVLIDKDSASRLMSLDKRISRFVLKTASPRFIPLVVQDLRQKLSGTGLKVATWEDLIPMMAQLIHFQDGISLVVLLIVLVVVTVGILNTLMMSIVERIREFGLMMALGTNPRQVILLVVCESFLLTMVGCAAGVLLGVGCALYFGHVGISLARFVSTFANFLIGTHVYPRVDWFFLLLFVSVVLVANLLVSFYPAWRASKLIPIDAMRQVA